MRIKILVLPQNEKICIIASPNSSINELKQLVHATLIKYPLYQTLLSSCTVVLELRTNNQDYAISGSYLIRELLQDKNDIIVAKFVSKTNSMFQKLQPQQIDSLITTPPTINTVQTTNNIPIQNPNLINEQKKEEKQMLQEFQNATIFDLLTKYSCEMKTNDDKKSNTIHTVVNVNEHKSLLIKLQTFCINWFEQKYDTQYLLLDELSQVLYSLFPTEINYLKSLYNTITITNHSWQQQLFIELGIQQIIDAHITFAMDMNKGCYQLKWNNYWVFDKRNANKLMDAIKHMLISDVNTWRKYGFGLLCDAYFNETKQEWFQENITTIYGENIVTLPGWNHLIIDLRNSKLMTYAWNSKPETFKLVKTTSFKNSFTDSEHGYEINTDRWFGFCLDRKILPITLLKYWMTESKQKFLTKKEFNKCIKIIGKIPATNINKWMKQKNEYYNVESLEEYSFYVEACAVCKKYIDKYKGKLNQKLCDQMIELYLNDSVQGFNSEAADIQIAELFEKHIVDKFRLIVSCINNGGCNINNNGMKITLLDQNEQQLFWAFLRNKYMYAGSQAQRCTPDILLNEPIIINNNKIHWIDAKHWFITQSSKLLFKKFVQCVSKYTKAFGTGAIICNGFEENVDQYQSVKQFNVTLLDGSRDLSVYQ